MTQEQLEKIKRDLTVFTDEAEGTQSISLDLINICDPDGSVMPLRKSPEEIFKDVENALDSDNVTIYNVIEFGDDYVLGDKLSYKLEVKPGPIKIGESIATIVQNGVNKKIKSKFNGVVMGNDESFTTLFPNANRHIIIKEEHECKLDDTVTLENLAEKFPDSGGFNYNPNNPDDPLVKIQEKFKLNSELYNLIKDNLCESVLPTILCNRPNNIQNDNDSETILPPVGIELFNDFLYYDGDVSSTHDIKPEAPYKKTEVASYAKSIGGNTLGNILSYILDTDIKTDLFWTDIFQDLCSEENIEKCKNDKSKTGVDIDKLNKIADNVQNVREYYIQSIIDQYNSIKTLLPCNSNYDDCKYLAYTNSEYFKSGTLCNNYYVNLLSRVIVAPESKYGAMYKDLLTNIINTREAYEFYSKNKLIYDFNNAVKDRLGLQYEDYYKIILETFKSDEKNLTFDDAKNIISGFTDKKSIFIDDLVNICMFITTMRKDINEYAEFGDDSYYDEEHKLKDNYAYELVKDENRKLTEFWTEIIRLYNDCSIEKCKKELLDYIAKQTGTNVDGNSESVFVDAEWPAKQTITVNNQDYNLYVFENRVKIEEPTGDETEPSNDEDAKLKEADEPRPGEITIFDCEYWYVYFALATVISLPLVMDWADGLDIPTPAGIISIPLPGIYICIACLPIKMFNIVIVFGLAIRGMWIFPIILIVNMSSTAINFLLPLKIAVEKLKEIFSQRLSSMENTIADVADVLIYQLEEQNKQYRIQNKQYEVYKAALKSQQVKNKALIDKGFKEAYMADADHRQVITRMEKLKDVPVKKEFE